MTAHIKTKIEDSTLVVTIDRPEAKNALSLAMYRELTAALIELDANPSLTNCILYGSEQCFTAGNDLKDFLSGGKLNRQHPTVELLYQLATTEKPIIAAVAGPAIGIGTTLLLHCDLVVAAENSIFQLPFARLGLCPEGASSLLLPNLIGQQKAFELLVLGERFDGKEAKAMGMVNKLVEQGSTLSIAREYADKLAKLPQQAVVSSKALIRADEEKVKARLAIELTQFQTLMDSEEAQQIINQFFQK